MTVNPLTIILSAMAKGQALIRHRDGFALTDGSISCRWRTFQRLIVNDLIKPRGEPGQSWAITATGRAAINGRSV